MKALSILHTESSIGWGGQELRILTEMEGMARRGHRVHLVTAATAEILPAARAARNRRRGLPIEAKKMHGLRAMRRWLAQHGAAFDVINTHSSTDAWLVALARATLKGLPPVLRTRHVSTPVNNTPTTRWLYQRATAHLVVTGEALKAQLVRDNGYDAQRASRRCAPASTSRAFARATAARHARDCASTRVRRWRSSRRCATGRVTTTCSTRGRRCASACRVGSCS